MMVVNVPEIFFSIRISNYYTLTLELVVILLLAILGSAVLFYRNNKEKLKQESMINSYADCMVDTYFYGYLKKVIPDEGTPDNAGIRERILQFKEKNDLSNEQVPLHKIFIYIPASGYIPATIDEIDKRVQLRKNLDPNCRSRAGVPNRKYFTTAYEIKYPSEHQSITVALEGAPPLLTLRDSCKEWPELKKYKEEIILLFYKKLKKKLEDNEEFKDSYELLYFNDRSKSSLADEIILRTFNTEDI